MQTIRNIFHTETWWGKVVFIIVTYIAYWLVFYGSWFMIPYDFFYIRNIEINQWIFLIIFCFIIPIISFYIPYNINNIFKINKTFLYSLHVLLIVMSLVLFFYFGLTIAFSHFQIG